MFSDVPAAEYGAARAAEAAARHRRDLLLLAARRTRLAAERMVERDHARQSRAMKPYVLPVGALVHVSFLSSPTVRGLLKTAFHRNMLRTYTEEVYRITDVDLAPRSRRVFLYAVAAVDDALQDGEQ